VVDGHGVVEVRGTIRGFTFNGGNDDIHIKLADNARALFARGCASVTLGADSVFTGVANVPFSLRTLKGGAHAELVDVDIIGLGTEDLEALEALERFTPVFPAWGGKKWARRIPLKASWRDTETLPTFRHPVTGLRKWLKKGSERAHFWNRVAEVLTKTHAPGALQSKARFWAARARRKQATGRERILMNAYALVGYGERVVLPLLVFVAIAALGAWFLYTQQGYLAVENLKDKCFGVVFARTLLLPFNFLKLTSDAANTSVSTPALAVTTFVRVSGFVLIGFAAFAARRVARVETR